MYEIKASVEYIVAAGTPTITTQIFLNDGASSAVLMADKLVVGATGTYTVNLTYYLYVTTAPKDIALRVSSTTAVTLTKQTTFTVTNLGNAVT